MSTFADASAVVKLYADETGHACVRAVDTMVVSQLTRVEVASALSRKHRLGELQRPALHALLADFEADYFGTDEEPPRFVVVALTAEVVEEAARVVRVHGLRASDAVQLASALAVRRVDARCDTFLAFDQDLVGAASAEGFTCLP